MIDASSPIPVIDLGAYLAGDAEATRRVAEEIDVALTDVGFISIVGHGFDWSLVDGPDGIFAQARRLFSLPQERKDAIASSEHRYGYRASGDLQYAQEGSLPARNESWTILAERVGVNHWPDDLPDFRRNVLTYHDAVSSLAYSLLPAMAVALDMPADYFTSRFRVPHTSINLRYYPICEYLPGQWGLGAHSDNGFLTLLPANDIPGLSIRISREEWVDQPRIPQSFLVNSGTILRRWTNDRWLSTEHRVINQAGVERYAAPFFYMPQDKADVSLIPTCVDEQHPARYEEMDYDLREYSGVAGKSIHEQRRLRSHANYDDAPTDDPSVVA